MYENLDSTRTITAILVAVLVTMFMHYPNLMDGIIPTRSKKKSSPTHKTVTGENSDGPLTIIKGLKEPSV